jgi:DNA-binding transcriptional LysR family regulator
MKNATLRQLTVFETVARCLSFTRAAEELGVSQAAVSIQVKNLEENLGLALFEQIGKKIYLTEAGRELYRYCREIGRQLAAAETTLERLKGIESGQLRLVATSAAKYFMPRLLAEFLRGRPGVTVDLRIANREVLLAQLDANECDMAVMVSAPAEAGLVTEPFLTDPLVVVAAPDHPLAAERAIPLERLAAEPFLMREPGSATRLLIEEFFGARGLSLSAVMVVNSNEAIKHGVGSGLGVAILPWQSVVHELEAAQLARLDVISLDLEYTWCLVHRQEKRFSCVAEAFRAHLLQAARQLAATPAGRADAASPRQRAAAAGGETGDER